MKAKMKVRQQRKRWQAYHSLPHHFPREVRLLRSTPKSAAFLYPTANRNRLLFRSKNYLPLATLTLSYLWNAKQLRFQFPKRYLKTCGPALRESSTWAPKGNILTGTETSTRKSMTTYLLKSALPWRCTVKKSFYSWKKELCSHPTCRVCIAAILKVTGGTTKPP